MSTTQKKTIEQMAEDAMRRLASAINRSAGQHLRAMRLAAMRARAAQQTREGS